MFNEPSPDYYILFETELDADALAFDLANTRKDRDFKVQRHGCRWRIEVADKSTNEFVGYF